MPDQPVNPAPVHAVLDICRQTLGQPGFGPEDDFFAAGGNSLQSMLVIKEIRAAYGVRVPPRGFYERPTAAALAALVTDQLAAGAPGANQ
ncbi:acyl carrier protein [Streptomyces sp. NPDC005760]|uniref:acyl carrier protein n=1 Tax=Streptomyces sp. NPDC005760 TaxID=3156718 RepID=UPI0033ED11B6